MTRIPLTFELMNSFAQMLPSTAFHFVLREDVADWIDEHGFPCRILYDMRTPMVIHYEIVFEDDAHATLFKLWWL